MIDYLVPILFLVSALLTLRKKENAYDLLTQGAAEGLRMLVSIIPALVVLLTAVTMLQASGATELLSKVLAPVFCFFG